MNLKTPQSKRSHWKLVMIIQHRSSHLEQLHHQSWRTQEALKLSTLLVQRMLPGITYSLKSVDDYTSFTIDEVTGVVTLTGDPDFESQSSYIFSVVATDESGNFSEQPVTLFITDLDDTAPTFTSGTTAS